MGHGASVASTAPHWTATKTTLRLINVKAKKGGHRKDRNSRTPSSTNAADDDEDNCPLPPGLHHAPPFLHHKTTSRIKPRSSKGKPDQDIPCHSLVDMQFRADGYQWIADALEKETKAALRQVRDRVGRDRHVPQVRFFTTNGDGIDLVRCRLIDMPLESFSRCIWGTFTSTMTYDDWSVQCLERLDDNTCYCRVVFDHGIAPNVPLRLNILQRQVRTKDRVVIVLRNVVEDNEFPLPPQSVRLLMNGWFVFDRDHQNATLARTLVQCHATRTDNNLSEEQEIQRAKDPPHYNRPRKPWLRQLVGRLFDAVDATNTAKLHVSPPEAANLVIRKHSAASNGNYLESR